MAQSFRPAAVTSRRRGGALERTARRGLCVAAPLLVAALLPAALLSPVRAAAEGGGETQTVTTFTSSSLGTYLTDGEGRTLYFSTDDLPGISNCTAGCLTVWPPFFARRINVTPPLHAADFGTIVRDKGERQITYRGWPLYYYSRDWAPHDTNGQSLYGSWYVVQPDLLGSPAR